MSQSESDPEDNVEEITDSQLADDEVFNVLAPQVPVEVEEQSFFEDPPEQLIGHPLLEEEDTGDPLPFANLPPIIAMPPTAREQELVTNIEVAVEEIKGYLTPAALTGAARRSVNLALQEIDASLVELNTVNIKKISRENVPEQKTLLQNAWIQLKSRLVLAVKEQQELFEEKIQAAEPAAPAPVNEGVGRAVA